MMRSTLTPWRDATSLFSLLGREMDEHFNRVFGDWAQRGPAWVPMTTGSWPHIKSYVDGQTLFIKADLPGVDPKDVTLTVEGNQLIIKGERKVEQQGQQGNSLHREIRYGSFARTLALPEGVRAEEVKARYHNGVLEISIPLPAAIMPKQIPIATESATPKQLESPVA